MRKRSFFLAAVTVTFLIPASPIPAQETLPDGFYRYPTIGGGFIVFASEGDLWKVPETGGAALRLTAYEGEERFPRISPDGRWIAFTGQYEGNGDVYLMSMDGGEPKRLTYHPIEDAAIGWTADGRILYRSRRDSPNADYRMYALDPAGGVAERLPLEPAAWVAFEPGGGRVALQKIGLEFHNWKRYKGGEAEQIYVGTLSPLAFEEVTKYEGKDAFPMWHTDGRIYFVTDRWGRPNLASMNPDGSDVKRLTKFDDYDVRWPSLGGGKIVYQHKMDLWVYEIATGKNEMVPVRLPSDRLQVREKFVDPLQHLTSWSLSKDGGRIVLESRGEVFVTRTKKKGLIRRITENSGARTRFPAFSPDGKWIAAWSDPEGEEQLHLHAADNSEPPRKLGTQPPGWHFGVAWSPDGKRLAWGDQKCRILVADAATGKASVVDTAGWEIRDARWSPDSRYLAFSGNLGTWYATVRIWDSRTGEVHTITDPMYDSYSPAWDPEGKYLYYLSTRHINPFLDRSEARFIVNDAMQPCVVALQADGALPFPVLGDADPEDGEKEDGDEKEKNGGKAEKESVEPIRIDFDGIAGRLVEVPVKPGNYRDLAAVKGKLHFIDEPNRGMMPWVEPGGEPPRGGTLHTYDIEKKKLSTLAEGVLGYDVSMDGKVLVYRTKEGFTRVEAGATKAPEGDEAKEAKIDLSAWTLKVNPRQEWKQMLREAWRLERDFFYDPNMHGVDWEAVWRQYGPLADRISTRDDLADIFGEMFGELSAGHTYHWGGDVRRGKLVGTGLLGADLAYDPESGFWRIGRIYRGDYPMEGWTSPLARADLRVTSGMWLVAIDGKPLQKGEDYLKRLANRAGKEVELSVNEAPRVEGARRIVVKPLAGDTMLRYATWVRENRARVDSLSGGRIGYIHLYDMGDLGLRQFARDYPAQWMKRGLIIDDRWNHGGFVAPMILTHLDRKLFSVGMARNSSALYTTPDKCFQGYLTCLINRQGGSDCETFAQGFKEFGMGPVIGTRTWGGWVGIRGDKPLRDGGMVTQPEFSGWDRTGKYWQIEGHGVDPDVTLDLGPDGLLGRDDVQLDYAVRDLLQKIERDPKNFATAPPYPSKPLTPVN